VSTKKESAAAAGKSAAAYAKDQFMQSKQFSAPQKDMLDALLIEDQTYTLEQVKKMLQDTSKRTVS